MHDAEALLTKLPNHPPADVRESLKAELLERAAAEAPDRALLLAIAKKHWDDVLVELVPFTDPETLSKDFLLSLLSLGCPRSAYAIAQRAARAGVRKHDPSMWIVGTLVQCEAPIPQEVEPLLGWSPGDLAALFETFVNNYGWFTNGIAKAAVEEFRVILLDLYKRKRAEIDEHLDGVATQFASKNTAGVAVGVTVSFVLTLFIGVPVLAFSGNAAAALVVFLASIVAGVWSGDAVGQRMRRNLYARRLASLRERQARIEDALGYAAVTRT